MTGLISEATEFMEHRRNVPSEAIRGLCAAAGSCRERSYRAVANEFGPPRETVRNMLEYAMSRAYQRKQPIRRIKFGPCVSVIDVGMDYDKQMPLKRQSGDVRAADACIG